jgi:hypothetical protein
VEPETRWEVVQGSRVQASPARPPHADRHFTIDYVLGAHLAPGSVGATDLLTRWSSADDYATDTSVRRAGLDEATGERHLEEMAFEVAYAQRRAELEVRARLLSRRGVRRVFAVFVKEGTVEEWSRDAEAWQALAPGGIIADACLAEPITVRALLDAAARAPTGYPRSRNRGFYFRMVELLLGHWERPGICAVPAWPALQVSRSGLPTSRPSLRATSTSKAFEGY